MRSEGLSKVFSNTTVQKHQFFSTQVFLIVQFSHPYITTGKTIVLTTWTFIEKVMSLLFNMLSRMISVRFQGKPFNIMIIQIYAPTNNAEEADVEWFYKDLQDLLELTPPKDDLFIIGDQNAKVGSQETPGVTGKIDHGVQNEAGQRLIKFCQENTLVIANTLFQQHKRRLYTWTSPDGQYRNQIDYILCSQR